jgi:hypothetical protein
VEKAEQLLAELTAADKTNVQYRAMYDRIMALLNKIRKDKKP